MDIVLFIRSNFKRGLMMSGGLFLASGLMAYGVPLANGFLAFWSGCASLVLAVAGILVIYLLVNTDQL